MSALITAEGLVRLDAALAWIDENPEQHDQVTWFERTPCGTTMCLAGVVATLAGAKPVWEFRADESDEAYSVELPDGTTRRVQPFATELLGVDVDAAFKLFGAGSLERIYRLRDELAASLVGAA